jgi:UDP-N-acetylmuramoyl-L-alanyl-D-glutamate--2,6-diaminopimelate ligase
VTEGIRQLAAVPGRLEKVENHVGISILVDYAHTPDALEKVLTALRGLMAGPESRVSSFEPEEDKGFAASRKSEVRSSKLICVFGCGGDRDRGKRPLMGEIASRLSDLVVLTSDNPRTEEPLRILAEIDAGVQKSGLKKFQVPTADFRVSEMSRAYCIEADRRKAIRIALRAARPGDLVLIAGKGHEDYQILGTKKIHFDDREVVREEVKRIEDESRV